MIDTATPKGRILAAAFALAAERKWAKFRSPISMTGRCFARRSQSVIHGKGAMLAPSAPSSRRLLAARPDAHLTRAHRDALFEVIMSRLDACAPSSRAQSSRSGLRRAPARHTVCAALDARRRRRAEHGAAGRARAAGWTPFSATVFRTWPTTTIRSFARTIVSLDRRPRRAARARQPLETICHTRLTRIASTTFDGHFRRRRSRHRRPMRRIATSATGRLGPATHRSTLCAGHSVFRVRRRVGGRSATSGAKRGAPGGTTSGRQERMRCARCRVGRGRLRPPESRSIPNHDSPISPRT